MNNTEHTFGQFKRITDAKEKRNKAASRVSSPSVAPVLVPQGEKVGRDSKPYKALFSLQNQVEKGKPMDYHEYAAKLWEKITGKEPDARHTSFRTFEGSIIARLHDIEMHPLVYDHVQESMSPLLKKYQDSVKMISLWSKGDVAATGYQVGKIESSRIIQDFMREVFAQLGTAEGKEILRKKVRYDVADDKIQNLVLYVKKELLRTEGKLKIVMIDDMLKNFSGVQERLGEEADGRVDIIPIWATYSRDGLKEKREANINGQERDFLDKKRRLNGIDSFKDLLDDKRFAGIFRDAHVFIDFDGTIADNLRLRDAQANAILSACVDGLAQEWGKTREQTNSEILSTLEK